MVPHFVYCNDFMREMFLDQLHKARILLRKLEVVTFTGLADSGQLQWIFYLA
jgi:hypothetical protein